MESYEFHRDINEFTFIREGEVDWIGKFQLSMSGIGFTANDRDGNKYKLKSSGTLFWRKLKLLKNGAVIDTLTPYKSLANAVALKYHQELFIDGNHTFTLAKHKKPSDYGYLRLVWQSPSLKKKEIVYCVLLSSIQASTSVVGTSIA